MGTNAIPLYNVLIALLKICYVGSQMIKFTVRLPETARPINKRRTAHFLVAHHWSYTKHIQMIWKLNLHMWHYLLPSENAWDSWSGKHLYYTSNKTGFKSFVSKLTQSSESRCSALFCMLFQSTDLLRFLLKSHMKPFSTGRALSLCIVCTLFSDESQIKISFLPPGPPQSTEQTL